MPILLWIAFWSTVTGVATGWQAAIRVRITDRRDQSTK
jgi:hypothetical protein